MKILKYLLLGLVVVCAVSCSDEPILRGEDDPVHTPPPPPKPGTGTQVPGDTLNV
jgi:hypothetical protein